MAPEPFEVELKSLTLPIILDDACSCAVGRDVAVLFLHQLCRSVSSAFERRTERSR